jgi:dTDP-glucose 4,6-dehydratase
VRVLLTGGAGFIGHHVVDDILRSTDWSITLIDRLDCSGNLNRLAEVGCPNDRVRFFYHDLRASFSDQLCAQLGEHDYILHLAAGTHVDRSIADPLSFVFENVVATCNLLEYARRGCERFLYFSTDEVFGPAPEGVRYKEWDRYKSGNPYAATKAGGEELAIAFHNTYGVPVVVTHTMNVFGERQHPEKFIPSTIRKVRDGETVTVHADKTRTKAGTRFYIHAAHVANAVRFVLANGTPGDKYNIVGEKEVSNLALAHEIAKSVGKSLNFEMVDFHSSRPGHDLRYALDGSKLAEMGWTPPNTFEKSLSNTVHWTLRNERWLRS